MEANGFAGKRHRLARELRGNETFDLIFADPPYALPRLSELPDLIIGGGLLTPDGLLILEHGKDHNFADHPQFMQERIYGSVHFSFFKTKEEVE
jgi:16S rRNA G966 N2-methylase RsmD